MKFQLTIALAAALAAGPAPAAALSQSPVEASAPVFVDEAYAALMLELKSAQSVWNDALDVATSTERKALRSSRPERAFYPRFRAAGKAGSGQALLWTLKSANKAGVRGDTRKEYALEHATLLMGKHVDEAWLIDARAFKYLARQGKVLGHDVVERLFRTAGRTAKKVETRALVLVTLATRLQLSRDKDTRKRGVELRESIAKDFPMERLQAAFSGAVFADMFLNVGQVAPDFSAQTAGGESFKLSDARGKITLVDFWGFW